MKKACFLSLIVFAVHHVIGAPTEQEIAVAIEHLGAANPKIREAAERFLLDAWEVSEPRLRRASERAEASVRARAREIVAKGSQRAHHLWQEKARQAQQAVQSNPRNRGGSGLFLDGHVEFKPTLIRRLRAMNTEPEKKPLGFRFSLQNNCKVVSRDVGDECQLLTLPIKDCGFQSLQFPGFDPRLILQRTGVAIRSRESGIQLEME